eukprot:3278862-Pleurochrysis_carterae.AAC.1
MRASVSSAAELRTAVKGLGEAVEVMQLSKEKADELNAKDGTPTRQMYEGGVCATRDRGKGD